MPDSPIRSPIHAMPSCDTLILGAGAAGLMCAITAARRGRRVLVLDRSNKPGKKILMSGGGKCNFTNLHCTPERFVSANPHFCKSALARYTQWDFIEMVEAHGIEYFEKQTVNGLSGQLFCRDSSKRVVAMLLAECEAAGVELRTGVETEAVEPRDGFRLQTSVGSVHSETLVVASGGLSIPSLGGSGFGYTLARQFGLRLLPTSAGLVPLTFTDAIHGLCERLSGLSCEVTVRTLPAPPDEPQDSRSRAAIEVRRVSFREDLLFTHRGLSGPAILQLSSYWRPGEAIAIDLLPGDDARALLMRWKRERPKSLLRTRLATRLPDKLVGELETLHWADCAERPLAEWPDRRLEQVAERLSDWQIKPAATEGYRSAEVTLGGVDTRDLSSRTLESTAPGLFFIGEVVDVTGHLGGFNFQWAWSSGVAAGEAV